MLLVVRPEPVVVSLLLVVRPGAPSSVLAPSSKARSPQELLSLVVRLGAPSSVLAMVVVRPGALLLILRPGP